MKNFFKKIIIKILIIEAKMVLRKYKPKIVSITGSVGKTSTKDAVFAVLSNFFYVRKSDKSYNSQIGLPLTILGLPNAWSNPVAWLVNILKGFSLILFKRKYPEWLVLEVGVGKPKDMQETASWLKSDIVIITAIGETPPHVEFFNSRKHLIEEKSGLIDTLKKDGYLILNNDDPDVLGMKNKTRNLIFTYGFSGEPDVLGREDKIFYNDDGVPQGLVFRVEENGKSVPVFIDGVFGRNYAYSSLGALTVASCFKLNMLKSADAFKKYEIANGRMRLLEGVNESFIIDDTYNSSPLASMNALKTLKEVENKGRKIAVLGDMLELGKHTEEAHKNIGKEVFSYADILFVVGPRAKFIKDGALESGAKEENIFHFSNSFLAGEYLKDFVKKGDLVLIKGSQGVRMEKTVFAILKDKKSANKLLVRQDKEWLERV